MALRPPEPLPYAPIGGVDLPPEILASGVFCTGATGSGKNLAFMDLLYRGLLPHYNSIVLDAKCTEIEILRGVLPERRIANLHPIDAEGYAWDLQRDLRSPLAIADAVYALIPDNTRDSAGRFFDSSARGTAEAALGVFAFEEVVRRLASLGRHWDLRDLLCAITPENIRAILIQTDRGQRAIATVLENAATSVDREQDIITSICSHIDRFAVVAAALHQHNLAARRFSINDWAAKKTPQTCLRIALDEQYEHALHPYVAWEIGYALRRLLGRSTRTHIVDTVIFLNEVQAVVKYLGPLGHFLTKAREKGCAVIATTQNFVTLNDAADNSRASQIFLDNCGTQVFFRTDSSEVAEAASRLAGKQEYLRWQPTSGVQETDGYSFNVGRTRTESAGRGRGEGSLSYADAYSRTPSHTRGTNTGSTLVRQTQELLPPYVFLNLHPFSRTRGVECFVRCRNHLWLATMTPEWLAARTPKRVVREEASLDESSLHLSPWTQAEEDAFLGTEATGLFDHIGTETPASDESSPQERDAPGAGPQPVPALTRRPGPWKQSL